jgi:hypothetical protein
MGMDKWKVEWSQNLGWEKILIWFVPWVMVVFLVVLFSNKVEELKRSVVSLDRENIQLINELRLLRGNN